MERFLFHEAVEEKSVKKIELAIKSGHDINTKIYRNSFTPLHLAIYNKCNKKIIQLLLENGADVNIKCGAGQTVLDFTSSIKKNFEIVKLLLEHGAAGENAPDDWYLKSILHALNNNKLENLKLLLEYGAEPNILHEFLSVYNPACNYPDMLSHLIQYGSDIHSQNSFEDPVLNAAIRSGNYKAV